jgi:chromosome segregation ATPase
VERDLLIKGLKEAAGRLEGEIRERNSELSRIRSPNLTPMMRSPNQSFVVENIRYEEELKLLADQLDRRNEEVGKLKKEREQRLKQYRDLEIEYENLQEESNKRRMELNSLRRQNTTIENLELETENLRTTITKRNSEINELKNALFEADRLRMDLDNRAREVDKLTEISRMKAKEIEQLSERNYELEEKLRQRDFKLNAAFPARNDPPATRGAQ